MNASQPFIILTDATSLGDDGVAIAMALADPRINVKLIVCTSGNAWADEVAENVRRLLSRLGRTGIPVCVSMPGPAQQLRAKAIQAGSRHEKFGYVGAFSKPFPQPTTSRPECKELYDVIAREPGVNLLVLAPASAILGLQREQPRSLAGLGSVYVMGGALNVAGNVTPYAEFNFWFDPQSADALMSADLDVTVFPLDVTNRLHYPTAIAESRQPASPGLAYLREYLAHRRGRSKTPLGIWDEALVAIVLRPELIESTMSTEARIATDGVREGKFEAAQNLRRRKVKIITSVDQKRLVQFVLGSLNKGRS